MGTVVHHQNQSRRFLSLARGDYNAADYPRAANALCRAASHAATAATFHVGLIKRPTRRKLTNTLFMLAVDGQIPYGAVRTFRQIYETHSDLTKDAADADAAAAVKAKPGTATTKANAAAGKSKAGTATKAKPSAATGKSNAAAATTKANAAAIKSKAAAVDAPKAKPGSVTPIEAGTATAAKAKPGTSTKANAAGKTHAATTAAVKAKPAAVTATKVKAGTATKPKPAADPDSTAAATTTNAANDHRATQRTVRRARNRVAALIRDIAKAIAGKPAGRQRYAAANVEANAAPAITTVADILALPNYAAIVADYKLTGIPIGALPDPHNWYALGRAPRPCDCHPETRQPPDDPNNIAIAPPWRKALAQAVPGPIPHRIALLTR